MSTDHRLPRTARPDRYDLVIEPDLDRGVFSGSCRIDIEVLEPVAELVLNAAELEIDDATLQSGGETLDLAVGLVADAERAVLRASGPLRPGPAELRLSFRGVLGDRLRGFYRSEYVDAAGERHVIAATQFESTDARRAFPCWDEPDLKAVFGVTLVVPEHLTAVSNGEVASRTGVGEGTVAVKFEDTMVMSTYLVAFVVGELERTGPRDVDGVPLSVYHVPGRGDLAEFALEAGSFALRFFAGYYGIPYPAAKLDFIGIPDFAWGAMENLGAVTFRESALLVDPARATTWELMRVAHVVAHEVAHMWFGDLVTMKWWNGIWLNEAFATFAEIKCVDAFRPGWKRWLAFATDGTSGRSTSMEIDSLAATRPIEFPVGSPAEADAMFDALTYGKGAAVLRMFEQYLGEEAFRTGVSDYLQWYSHANAETDDLWEALEKATGQPVGAMMDTWIRQGGHPVVEVTSVPGGFELAQREFRLIGSGERDWAIPVIWRERDRGPEARLALHGPRTVAGVDGPVVVNAGGHGFYRVRYEPATIDELTAEIARLEPLERFTLVDDAWAFVLSGDGSVAGFLDLAGRFGVESEPVVWETLIGGFDELIRLAGPAAGRSLAARVRELVGPAAQRSGWEPIPGDTDLDRRMRGILLRTLGTLGRDEETLRRARSIWRERPTDVDPEVAQAALTVTAAHGAVADYDRFVSWHAAASSPQDEVRFLQAAMRVPDPELMERTLAMVLEGSIRPQDAIWVVAGLIGNPDYGDRAWRAVSRSWDRVLAVVPASNARRLLDWLPFRSDIAPEVEAWLADHPIPGAGRYTAQQLERLAARVALRRREADVLDA